MPDPDNQLRWLNNCCPDWEGGFSMNPCCPVSVSACVSLSKVADLCGVIDPDDDPDVKWPTVYKNTVTDASTASQENTALTEYERDTTTGDCSATVCLGPIYFDDEGIGYTGKTTTTTTVGSENETTGDCDADPLGEIIVSVINYTSSDVVVAPDITTTTASVCSPSEASTSYSGSFTGSRVYSECDGLGADGSVTTTTCSASRDASTGDWSGEESVVWCPVPEFCYTFGPFTNDGCASDGVPSETTVTTEYGNPVPIYSDADTESAALSAATETQGASCTSSNYRTGRDSPNDKLAVSKTTVKHEAVVTGLVIGFCYEGVIPIERALINFDEQGNRISPEPEDWLPFSLTAIDFFKAEEVFQTFGQGTLNVSDGDFINENFSLDPYSYPSYFPVDPETGILIDPDALVLTPFSDLPTSKLYDYRVLPAIMRRVECEEEE